VDEGIFDALDRGPLFYAGCGIERVWLLVVGILRKEDKEK